MRFFLFGFGAGTFTGFNSEPKAFCNFILLNIGIRRGLINLVKLGNFGGKIGKIGNKGNFGIRGIKGKSGNLGNLGNLRNLLDRIADFKRDLSFAFIIGDLVESLSGSNDGGNLSGLDTPGFIFIVTGAW